MKDKSKLSKGEEKLVDDILNYGWHVIKVMEDDQYPGFGYSIGLYHSFNHPEVIVIGLDLELIHHIINEIGNAVKDGFKYEGGKYYPDLLEGFDCYFIEVKKPFFPDYVGYAAWYYENDSFPLLQCIYPTTNNIYPWQPEWPQSIKNLQPMLGDIK